MTNEESGQVTAQIFVWSLVSTVLCIITLLVLWAGVAAEVFFTEGGFHGEVDTDTDTVAAAKAVFITLLSWVGAVVVGSAAIGIAHHIVGKLHPRS